MKKYVSYFTLIIIVSVFVSCASSKSSTTVLSGTDISKYKYVVFGTGDEGDAELADILMMVQNEISEKLQVVSAEKAKTLIAFGEKVASPKINIKTEKWDGGHTYISAQVRKSVDSPPDMLTKRLSSHGTCFPIKSSTFAVPLHHGKEDYPI